MDRLFSVPGIYLCLSCIVFHVSTFVVNKHLHKFARICQMVRRHELGDFRATFRYIDGDVLAKKSVDPVSACRRPSSGE